MAASISPRPDSMVSSSAGSAGTSWSAGDESSRPTSFGSDGSLQATGLHPSSNHRPSALSRSTDFRPPKHALMRLRRTSMPNVPLAADYQDASQPRLPLPSHIAMQKKRLSTASARSCDSLPEEKETDIEGTLATETSASRPSSTGSLRTSEIPLPSRRIRPKANLRRSSMSPSGLPNHTDQSSSSAGRPVSIALPATSPLVASNANGHTQAVESKTLARNVKIRTSIVKPSVRFSTPPSKSVITAQAYNTATRTARIAKKDRIANEILESERVYVGILSDVQEHFLNPLLASTKSQDPANPPVHSAKVIKEIFSNFADIHNLGKEILKRLEESVTSPPVAILPSLPSSFQVFASSSTSKASPAKQLGSIRAYVPPPLPIPRQIGQTLAPVLPFLKCYSLFVGNFANAQARLEKEERTNEAWKEFLKERKAKGIGNRLSLSAMLLCIVQRIPRYRLLLGDLLRFTDPSDPDYEALSKARTAVEEVANHLESSIKQHESSMTILDLQRTLTGLDFTLLSPGRRFLKSGILIKQGRRAEEERAFFLFGDILIYADVQYGWGRVPGLGGSADHSASPSITSDKSRFSGVWSAGAASASVLSTGNTYTYKRKLDLEDLSVVAAEGNAFEIRSPIKSFSVIAVSSQSKYEWISAIREAKEELLSSRRTLLTAEDEAKRSRMRRLSMPAPPPRSASTPILATLQSLVTSPIELGQRLGLPIVRLPSNDEDADDNFDDRSQIDEDSQSSLFSPGSETTSAIKQNGDYFDAQLSKLKVYEDYSAPIWVPDSRADKCMRCGEGFAVWRRRHHCRLCGDVVCWACSTKKFVIPSNETDGAPRVGRACDECFETCFIQTPPAEEIEDPLAHVETSSMSATKPIPPLLKKAASALEIAGLSHVRDESLEKHSQLPARSGLQATPRESVDVLRSVLARSG